MSATIYESQTSSIALVSVAVLAGSQLPHVQVAFAVAFGSAWFKVAPVVSEA